MIASVPAEAAEQDVVVFKFRLYINGDTQNSSEAAANLIALCETYIRDRHEIDFVDVALNPERALADGIFMTPTLIKLAPSPTRMIVGTLSNAQPLMQALGLHGLAKQDAPLWLDENPAGAKTI